MGAVLIESLKGSADRRTKCPWQDTVNRMQNMRCSLIELFDLAFKRHPVDLPGIAINAIWQAKVHRLPAHQWLRGVD